MDQKQVQEARNILYRHCRPTECVFCFLKGHCGYDFGEEIGGKKSGK